MAKRGAKNKYDTLVKPYLKEINDKVRQGVTEEQIAKALGISVASLNNYRNQHAEFKEALSKDKGADVLNDLINAGIEAAKGSYKQNKQYVYGVDEDNEPVLKQVVVNEVWQAPNPALNKFYVQNYSVGKEQEFSNDPLNHKLKQQQQAIDEKIAKAKHWNIDI